MVNFKIEKVLLIPETLSPNTIYLLPGTQVDTFAIYVSDNTGTSVKNLNIPLPPEPTSREVGFVRVPALDKQLLPIDKDTVLRFETNGDKTLTISLSSGFLPNSIFHISNRSASGDLTLSPVDGMYINPPKGGSLILEPGDTVSLHTVIPSVMDCYGSTAIGPVVAPAPLPPLPGVPQFYSAIGPVFWNPGDMRWINPNYTKAPVRTGDSIVALVNMQASKLRITYTSIGRSSFYLLLNTGQSIAFPQRDSGTWTDTIDVPTGIISIDSYLSANYGDTNLESVVITNIEIYSTVANS